MPVRQEIGRFVARSAVTALLAGAVAAAAADEPTHAGDPGAQQACPEGTIADVRPQEAIVARLTGKPGRIFIECCLESGPTGRTPDFDTVLILSGPDVMGGTVGLIARGECVVGHKFLGLVEFIHAGEVMRLYEQHPALQEVGHLDLAVLTELAEDGEPAAAFHVGFVQAMGWGSPRDRPGSIAWFRRAAETAYEPGMLALGMALAGPGVIDEQVLPVGELRPRDEFTDLVQACYWLRRLAQSQDALAAVAQRIYDDEVGPRLTSREQRSCRALLRQKRK